MLPHLNCIIVKDKRYHWCASIFYRGTGQHLTLIEVMPSVDRFSKVKGYDILMKMDKVKLITVITREEIERLMYERKIQILPEWKMGISENVNLQMIKKELEHNEFRKI